MKLQCWVIQTGGSFEKWRLAAAAHIDAAAADSGRLCRDLEPDATVFVAPVLSTVALIRLTRYRMMNNG